MTQNHAPSARPKSDRADATRTHRSQPKPARAQPILLDRLAAALAQQDVSLKRTALQSVAAAAFGFRNANEFAAADLTPPKGIVLGRALSAEQSFIVLRDPVAGLSYALPREQMPKADAPRAETYGVTPYGHLIDLAGLAADLTPDVADPLAFLHAATVSGPRGISTFGGRDRAALDRALAAHCRTLADAEALFLDETGDDAAVIASYLAQAENVAIEYRDLSGAPAAAQDATIPAVPAATTPVHVWIGRHTYHDGNDSYAGLSEAELYAKIADTIAIDTVWSEVEGDAGAIDGYPDPKALVEAYFKRHDEDTLEVTVHTLAISSVVAPAPEKDADAEWRAQIAKVRDEVEAAYPWEGWAQHPVYDTESWQQAVADGDTRLSYWEWLAQTLEEAANEEPYDPSKDDTDYLAALQASSAAVIANVTRQLAPKAAEIDEHPVYRRADWDAERRGGLTLTYAQWVRNSVSNRRDAEEAWLNASLFVNTGIGRQADHVDANAATTGTEPAKPGFDAILRIACVDPRPGKSGLIARPNDLVRVLRWADTPRGVSVWIRVQQDVEIQMNSWERDGMLPISAMPRLPDRVEQHPVYIYRDWLAERSRGARMIAYSDWVREHEDVDVLKLQNWLRSPCMDALKVAGQRFIIHVHSERGSSENDGAAQAQYAPGDSVFIEEAQFTGQTGGLTLSTTDGTRFDLYSEDRNGFFPVSMIPGTGEPLKVVDPTLRYYPQADWLADMKETHRALSYAEWAQARRAENAFVTERWLTLEALRALPGGTALQIHIHHAATIHEETGRTYDTVCRPGYPVRVAGVDDRTADVSVTFVTEDEGLFALRVADRGGYLPVSIRNPDRSVAFSVWIHRIEQELATTVDPDIYRVYYDQGLSPAEAIAADRAEDGEPEEVTTATTGDDFMWQVAEELGRKDLTHNADFQEFCGNMVGRVSPAQAAESWTRGHRDH